jgi:hypothetical protein
MKHLLTIIICIAIFNISCNQSNTTPTTPPANPCGITKKSNEYIELIINGTTLRNEALLGVIQPLPDPRCWFFSDPIKRRINIISNYTDCQGTKINEFCTFLEVEKITNGQDRTGIYDLSPYGSFSYYSTTAQYNKEYSISTLTVTITSCTNDFVTGTFVGTAIEKFTNITYPFTGSFNNIARCGG